MNQCVWVCSGGGDGGGGEYILVCVFPCVCTAHLSNQSANIFLCSLKAPLVNTLKLCALHSKKVVIWKN